MLNGEEIEERNYINKTFFVAEEKTSENFARVNNDFLIWNCSRMLSDKNSRISIRTNERFPLF